MHPDPQTRTAPELTVLAPASADPNPAADPLPSAHDPRPSPSAPLHRKIAKLPKPLRDRINSLIEDSVPAREIIAKLQASADPPLPYPISQVNLSDWKNTGYQRHLAQQERLATLQANREQQLLCSEDPRIWRPFRF